LLKNLNLSNIEFLFPDPDEEEEGLEEELLEEEVEEVDPALVLFDALSPPPDPGRPRPTGVGMPDGAGAAVEEEEEETAGEVARA